MAKVAVIAGSNREHPQSIHTHHQLDQIPVERHKEHAQRGNVQQQKRDYRPYAVSTKVRDQERFLFYWLLRGIRSLAYR